MTQMMLLYFKPVMQELWQPVWEFLFIFRNENMNKNEKLLIEVVIIPAWKG